MLWVAPLLSVLIGWSVWKFGWLEASASITLGIALWTALWWIFKPGIIFGIYFNAHGNSQYKIFLTRQ